MGQSKNKIARDAIDFINNYPNLADSDGNISDESIIKFTKDLEKFLDGYDFEGAEGEVLPYTGTAVIDGVTVPLYKVVEALSDGNNYQYISSTDLGNLINDQFFKDALVSKVGKDSTTELILWGGDKGKLDIGGGVLNLSDYTSQRLMSEVASGDVKPLMWEFNTDKVFFRTEFEALLKNKNVKSIWGEDISIIREIINHSTRYNFANSTEAMMFYYEFFAQETQNFLKDIDINIGYDKNGNKIVTTIDASKAGGGQQK